VLQCGKVDGRLKFFQAAKKRGFLHDLTAPRQILPWIEAEARRRGARLAGEAARRLAEIAGKDLGRLAQAIDQLALYVADGMAVTADDVDELIAETRERTVFELTSAVGASDRAGALGAVARLFDQRESPIGVAMMLARHFRQLGLAQEAAQGGARGADLPRLLGVPPFAVDGLVAQAKKLAPGAVPRAIALLARADRDLKGPKKGAVGERIVLERLIGELLDATSPRRP
jgi:DNA polymerase-3 subunit delta